MHPAWWMQPLIRQMRLSGGGKEEEEEERRRGGKNFGGQWKLSGSSGGCPVQTQNLGLTGLGKR